MRVVPLWVLILLIVGSIPSMWMCIRMIKASAKECWKSIKLLRRMRRYGNRWGFLPENMPDPCKKCSILFPKLVESSPGSVGCRSSDFCPATAEHREVAVRRVIVLKNYPNLHNPLSGKKY